MLAHILGTTVQGVLDALAKFFLGLAYGLNYIGAKMPPFKDTSSLESLP